MPMLPRYVIPALCACLLSTGAAWADDPADMVAAAKTAAANATASLSRRSLGWVALPTYKTVKYRSVRAHYRRNELVRDQIIFCGEMDAEIPGKDGVRSGWTKFVYSAGDPTVFMTDTPGLGTGEIGPRVRKAWCESGKEVWLSGDFTAGFETQPRERAVAASEE